MIKILKNLKTNSEHMRILIHHHLNVGSKAEEKMASHQVNVVHPKDIKAPVGKHPHQIRSYQ